MSEHAPGHDDTTVTAQEMSDPLSPYPRLAWIWVYGGDPKSPEDPTWVTTGTGVFIDDDVVVTCAHIFAQRDSPLNVLDIVVEPGRYTEFPGEITPLRQPTHGLVARRALICGKALPVGRRSGEFDMAWDLALVFLAEPAPRPPQGPRFVLHEEFELAQGGHGGVRPEFSGGDCILKFAGYGGTRNGVLTWAPAPIESDEDIQVERHWLRVRSGIRPGHSGGPIFYQDKGPGGQVEYRLVGICSADDRKDPRYTLGPIITPETMGWFDRALVQGRQREKRRVEVFD